MSTLWRGSFAIVALCFIAACSDTSDSNPIGPNAMTYYGCVITPGCLTNGDPWPNEDGYWMGVGVTPSSCFNATGAGINDVDRDGTSDYCEEVLAERFRPALSFGRYDCDTGHEPYWAAKAFPAQGGFRMRIAYLFSYYWDCGSDQGFNCAVLQWVGTVLSFNGLIHYGELPISPDDPCASHQGDSEFLIVDLAYAAGVSHWYVDQAFFSAHWMRPGDHSALVPGYWLTYPEKVGGYPLVFASQGKHANYATRSACANTSLPQDYCNSNPDRGVRLAFSTYHNIGSAHQNMINPGACVTGGRLVAYYPENYGTECFWVPRQKFKGWERYAQEHDATPYYTVLIVAFECYAWQSGSCVDWGTNR